MRRRRGGEAGHSQWRDRRLGWQPNLQMSRVEQPGVRHLDVMMQLSQCFVWDRATEADDSLLSSRVAPH
jgi:hypothetical protein